MEDIGQHPIATGFFIILALTATLVYLILVNVPDTSPVVIAQWLYSVTNSPYSELDQRVEELKRLLPKAEVLFDSSSNGRSLSVLIIKSENVTRTYSLFPTFGGTGYVAT